LASEEAVFQVGEEIRADLRAILDARAFDDDLAGVVRFRQGRMPIPGKVQAVGVVLRDAFAHQRLRDRVQVLADRVLLRDLDF